MGTWAKLFMSLSIFFSLPVKMFPAVQALERIAVPADAPCARAAMCVGLALCSSALAVRPPVLLSVRPFAPLRPLVISLWPSRFRPCGWRGGALAPLRRAD